MTRNCPQCKNPVSHRNVVSFKRAVRHNAVCHRCSVQGRRGQGLGRKASLEARRNISKSHLGQFVSGETRCKLSDASKNAWNNPSIRKKYYDSLARTKYLQVRTDKGQLELLEKWNRLGFKFEPNYQVHTDTDLFYIDGYDKEHNVVLEYDSHYHTKLAQQQKDLIRQHKVIDILKPKKFWRYNAVKKQCENVLGE